MVVLCLHIEENTLNLGFEGYLPREFWVSNAPFFSFWLLLLITQFVLFFFFFEAVYIEIIFILKDNKTIKSNELAILFNERLLFVCLWYEQIMYWTSHTVHILYLDSIVWVKSSFIIRVYNSWTTHLFFLGFTLLSSYVLFYLRHENTTVITI